MDNERLVRIEAKQDAINEKIDRFFNLQDTHNKTFYSVRDKVLAIQAGKNAVGWLLGVLGAMVVALAGFVAWAFSFIKPQ